MRSFIKPKEIAPDIRELEEIINILSSILKIQAQHKDNKHIKTYNERN